MDWHGFASRTGADRGVLVVAPHPDDETLGCGGMIALARRAGVPVRAVFVTDGEGSHPGSRDWPPARLAALRQQEARRALHVLGVPAAPVLLGLPDAGTLDLSRHADARALRTLTRLLRRDRPGLLVTTWRGEPHCDHVFASDLGRRAARIAGVPALEYEVWGPVTGEPDQRPAAAGARPLPLSLGSARAVKRRALQAHASQLGRVVTDDPGGFVLSPAQAAAMTGLVETYWRSS